MSFARNINLPYCRYKKHLLLLIFYAVIKVLWAMLSTLFLASVNFKIFFKSFERLICPVANFVTHLAIFLMLSMGKIAHLSKSAMSREFLREEIIIINPMVI